MQTQTGHQDALIQQRSAAMKQWGTNNTIPTYDPATGSIVDTPWDMKEQMPGQHPLHAASSRGTGGTAGGPPAEDTYFTQDSFLKHKNELRKSLQKKDETGTMQPADEDTVDATAKKDFAAWQAVQMAHNDRIAQNKIDSANARYPTMYGQNVPPWIKADYQQSVNRFVERPVPADPDAADKQADAIGRAYSPATIAQEAPAALKRLLQIQTIKKERATAAAQQALQMVREYTGMNREARTKLGYQPPEGTQPSSYYEGKYEGKDATFYLHPNGHIILHHYGKRTGTEPPDGGSTPLSSGRGFGAESGMNATPY